MEFTKKAVTPLMIGILLISFAIAVGVVIMNLGRAEVQNNAECAINTDLHPVEIAGVKQLCYDAVKKEITFTVENGVNSKLDGLIVNAIGQQKAETAELNDGIARAGTYVGHVPYDTAVSGEIKELKISPKLQVLDQQAICPEQAVVVDEIKSCEAVKVAAPPEKIEDVLREYHVTDAAELKKALEQYKAVQK